MFINDPACKALKSTISRKFAALFLASGLITGQWGEEFRENAESRPIWIIFYKSTQVSLHIPEIGHGLNEKLIS